MSEGKFARPSFALRLAGVRETIDAGVETAVGVGMPMGIVVAGGLSNRWFEEQ